MTPALRNLHARHHILETPSLGVRSMVEAGEAVDSYARELQAATEGLYQKLQSCLYGKGKKRGRIAGDVTKLRFANDLTPLERELLTNLRFMARKVEGAQEVRLMFGHMLF